MKDKVIAKQLNKVSKDKVIEALDYFWTDGFLEELKSDEQYYVKILLKAAANNYRIKLYDVNEEFAGYTSDKD